MTNKAITLREFLDSASALMRNCFEVETRKERPDITDAEMETEYLSYLKDLDKAMGNNFERRYADS